MRPLLCSALLLCSLTAIALVSSGCTRPMGMACDASGVCGEGTCLKGVCSGYECTADADCSDDHVCEQVAEMSVCVLECEDDGDCGGDQTCEEVSPTLDDDGLPIFICM